MKIGFVFFIEGSVLENKWPNYTPTYGSQVFPSAGIMYSPSKISTVSW